MAIAYKSNANATHVTTSGFNLDIGMPATVDAGDILIVLISFRDTTSSPSTPGGWTLLSGPVIAGSTATGRAWMFGKIADGTEDGATVNFGTHAITTLRSGRCHSFSGYVSGTITDVVRNIVTAASQTSATIADAGVTTTGTDSMAINYGYATDDNAISDGATTSMTGETGGDWVQRGGWNTTTAGSDGLFFLMAADMASPGTINGGTVSISASDPWCVIGAEIATGPLAAAAGPPRPKRSFVKQALALRPI